MQQTACSRQIGNLRFEIADLRLQIMDSTILAFEIDMRKLMEIPNYKSQ
jgi:hypothetical protein